MSRRYPEDIYNGVNTSFGNPWYLTTASMAELFYRAVATYQDGSTGITVTNTSLPFWKYFASETPLSAGQTVQKSSPQFSALLDALRGWGDAFIRRIKYHTPNDGRLAEEFHRNSGEPQGAQDLTWSYASILTAAFARADANGDGAYLPTIASSTGSSASNGTQGGPNGSKNAASSVSTLGLFYVFLPTIALFLSKIAMI